MEELEEALDQAIDLCISQGLRDFDPTIEPELVAYLEARKELEKELRTAKFYHHDAMEERDEARAKVEELEKALEDALEHQVANRGTGYAFYRCYTYENNQMPSWVANAERLAVRGKEPSDG